MQELYNQLDCDPLRTASIVTASYECLSDRGDAPQMLLERHSKGPSPRRPLDPLRRRTNSLSPRFPFSGYSSHSLNLNGTTFECLSAAV